MSEFISQFKEAMRTRGIFPPDDLIADGKIHRCDVDAPNGKNDGAYLLYPDFPQAGGFTNWCDGREWKNWIVTAERQFSENEKIEYQRKLEAVRKEHRLEEEKRRSEAKQKSIEIWNRSTPCVDNKHTYLANKKIKSHGLKIYNETLVIPLRNSSGEVNGLQFIDQNGDKKFLRSTQKEGNYFSIGKPEKIICIAEGFATGASIYEATGYAVAIAFDCGNLLSVAKAIRKKFSDLEIIICADDDYKTQGNPGLTKAREAAQIIKAFLAIPDFGTSRPDGMTDFNDLYRIQGIVAVKNSVKSAMGASSPVVKKSDNSDIVELIQGSDLKPEPITWFWKEWLAAGKMHILGGAPGTGKTTISMAFAAIITTGGSWPDGSWAPKGDVLIWSGEDDPSDTLVPRLLASGADMKHVFFIKGVKNGNESRAFDPAKDIQILRNELLKIADVKLIIIDPIVSAVTGDSHKNAEVRRSLQPLTDLAASMRCALLGITHFSKGTSGREPIERLTGSLAFGALPRVVLVTTRSQDNEGNDTRMLIRAKSNIGPDDGGFNYDLVQSELGAHPGIFTSFVAWGNPIKGTAREILAEAENIKNDKNEGGALEEAICFLNEVLVSGPLPQKVIEEESKGAGLSWSTVRRAKDALGIKPSKNGMKGPWFWNFPQRCSEKQEDTQQNKVSNFVNVEHLQAQPDSCFQESFEERAAITEFDDQLAHKEAERLAAESFILDS